MSNKMLPVFLLCETPMHVGVGSDVGIVDMPIQRERHTGWPKIEASELKGCIRNSFEKRYKNDNKKLKDINVAFGYDENGLNEEVKKYFSGDKEFSGALGFSDGRILLFPVKSMRGVFAWITCPAVLDRFFSDLSISGVEIPEIIIEKNTIAPESDCLVSGKDNIILEEFTEEVKKSEDCKRLFEWLSSKILPDDKIHIPLKEKMKKDIVILSNEMFTQFTNLSTEVITRTKIDNNTGTVTDTALFNEEYLPSETIMYSFAVISPIFGTKKGSFEDEDGKEEIEEFLRDGLNSVIQIGGNLNLGKGIVRTKIYGGE